MAEKILLDATVMKHRLAAHIATAIHFGVKDIPMGYESASAFEYMRGYERGAVETANIALAQQPVDAVEVVRCKDCKHFTPKSGYTYIDGFCNVGNTTLVRIAEGYCNRGERRE